MSCHRFYPVDALSRDRLCCEFYDETGDCRFRDFFLRYLHRKFGSMMLFLDNTSHHKSKQIEETLKEMAGDMVMRYSLPYTPTESNRRPVENNEKIHCKRAI